MIFREQGMTAETVGTCQADQNGLEGECVGKAIRHVVTAVMVLACLTGAPRPGAAQEVLPLSGPAFRIATEAYQAFDRHDYATAISRVREAIRQRPDVGRLRVLLVRALAAAGQGKQARQEARRGAGDPSLAPAVRSELGQLAASVGALSPSPRRRDPAYQAAKTAYGAYARHDYDQAVAKAHEAVSLMPSRRAYRELLANALAARDLGIRRRELGWTAWPTSTQLQAEKAADAAYGAIRNHRYAEAVSRAREAVRNAPDTRAFRLLLIDTLVRDGQRPDALAETVKAIDRFGSDAALQQQRGVLEASLGDQQGAYRDLKTALRLSPSAGETHDLRLSFAEAALATFHPKDALDALTPLGTAPGFDVWIQRGRALQPMKDDRDAETAFAKAGNVARTPDEHEVVIAAQIELLKAEGRNSEARAVFTSSRNGDALGILDDVKLAYLAMQAGDDRVAGRAFETARQKGELRGTQLIDAAYLARRDYHNDKAVGLFKQAIDSEGRGEFIMSPQRLYGLRREVADLTRIWGAYTTLNYGSSGITNASYLPPNMNGHTTELGSELYWRPPIIGYRDGALVEAFVREYTTLTNSTRWPTGSSSIQGSVGVRWKPLKRYNFVLEASKLFRVGKNSRNDMLLRAAISDGFGGSDLRMDVASWWTGQYYAEGGRYMQYHENIADGEARFGRSYRMETINDHLVMTPFLGIAANFYSYYATPFSLGAGPGINARYWFREDRYNAPRSYLDLTVQYRFHLAGDNRARGIFAGINFAY